MPEGSATRGIARSREEIGAARVLAEVGFLLQAISRAYYACFYAAEEALEALGGERTSTHSGLISAFGQRVVKEGGLDASFGRLLAAMFEERAKADYVGRRPTQADVEQAIADAERFVDAVEGWLEARSG